MVFSQLLVNGLIAGSIYALIASGFALIYSTNRFVHFAHGSVAATGAYFVYLFFSIIGLNFYLASFLAIIFTGLFGGLIFFLFYNPLIKRESSAAILLIASLGLSILLDNLLLLVFGADVKILNFIESSKGLEFLGAVITPLQIIIILTSLVSLCLLWFFVYKTNFGRIVRAVADNSNLAEITGINVRLVRYAGFVVGSLMAGVAGILIGLEQNIEPTMGVHLIVKGFTGAIVGGVTSIPGSVLGSYLLGIVENFGIWYLPSGYKDAIAFGLLLVFLLFRPTGILGINKGARK